MRRSFIYLRRALFGVSCIIVFGAGASQALAAPRQATEYGECVNDDPGADAYCRSWCQAEGLGSHGRCLWIGHCGCNY